MCSRCEPWNILYDDFLNEFACISTQCSKEVIQIYMFKEHSYLCILSGIKYICNTYTTGDIQFICMSFNNRYVSGMFRSECKLISYFPTVCAYCVYPAMPKIQNQLSNCLIKAETVVVLIVFGDVLCEVRAYNWYRFITSRHMNKEPTKLYSWLLTIMI